MPSTVFAVHATLGLVAAGVSAPIAAGPSLADRLASEADRFAGHLDGVVLVARGEEILLERALGVRDSRTGAPNELDTLFRVGSITKQLTAATVLALVEQGRLAFDAPLSRYLPEYPRENLARGGAEVTIEHLLRHTSGVERAERIPSYRSRLWSEPIDGPLFWSELMQRPLLSEPGRTYRYSNTGYMLLGEVVRRVTGGTFEEALRGLVLEPLEMSDTGIEPSTLHAARMARGRFPLGGVWVDSVEAFRLREPNLTDLCSRGAAFSSARDLLRWTRLFLDPGRGPLRPETVAAMTTPGLEDYGYGVVVDGNGAWRRVWHNGAISPLGFSSEIAVFLAQQLVVVVLSNDDYELGAAARLRQNLVAVLEGKVPPQPVEAGRKSQAAALGVGATFLFARGALRFVAPLGLVAWLMVAGLRGRRSSRLAWLERVLAPAGLLGLALGPVFDGSARQLLWIGSIGSAALGAALAARCRPQGWVHRGARWHGVRLAAVAVPMLAAAAIVDPGGTAIGRVLAAWAGLVGGFLWAERARKPAGIAAPSP